MARDGVDAQEPRELQPREGPYAVDDVQRAIVGPVGGCEDALGRGARQVEATELPRRHVEPEEIVVQPVSVATADPVDGVLPRREHHAGVLSGGRELGRARREEVTRGCHGGQRHEPAVRPS